MRRIRLLLFSSLVLASLIGITAFTGWSIVSAQANHTHASTHVTRPGSPHITCSLEGCDGLDPEKTGCAADAFTVQTAVFGNSYVELRFSPTCGTNWGRVKSRIGLASLTIRTQRIDGLTYTFAGGNYYYAWSAMVFAPLAQARACGGVNGISGCTAYV